MPAPHGYRAGRSCDQGFSLLEMLVALLLTLLIVSTALWLLTTDTALAESLPHAADLQQRGRLAFALLTRDLSRAGSGPAYGRLAGGLVRFLPPIVPRRVGRTGSEAFNTARADAVTVLWSSSPGRATETTTPVSGDTPVLTVKDTPNCGGVALCGLGAGAQVLIFDESGRHGLYTLTSVSGAIATLRSLQPAPSSFSAGAVVVPIESSTYFFDRAARQLRAYDDDASDVPVIDDVVDVDVAYWGEGAAAMMPKPATGTANCLFDAAGNLVAPLATMPSSGDSLAPLPLEMFGDGPWCGEGDRRFDADLLRIRSVRVRVRLQAALDRFRGSGLEFSRPGVNTRPAALVPDFTLETEVTPWNLNPGR